MSALATKVCWTLNNYSEAMIEAIIEKIVPLCKYLVYGKEVGENETPHLQGFLILKKRTRMATLTKKFKEATGKDWHSEIARGTNHEAAIYCKKDGDFKEWGSYPKGRGSRTDIADFLAAVRDGQDDDILAEAYPDQWVKYHKAADKLRGALKTKKRKLELQEDYENCTLRPWQQITLKKLAEQNDRQVTWVYDPKGNMGKSWLASYLLQGGNAYIIEGGKRADIAHAYNYEDTVVFDFTRSQEEQVNYSTIESFKNGRLFSSKYESIMKIFKPAKVLCLSNFFPDKSKLSLDRWQILEFPDPVNDEPPRKRRRVSPPSAADLL